MSMSFCILKLKLTFLYDVISFPCLSEHFLMFYEHFFFPYNLKI